MKWADIAFKFLSVLVLPLVAWGVRLQVQVAVLSEQVSALQAGHGAIEVVKAAQAANATAMARLEEKIDGTNTRLDDLKTDLRRSLPPP